MHGFSFLDAITDSHPIPQSFDQPQIAPRLADLLAASGTIDETLQHAMQALLADARAHRVLAAVFAHSPFLSRLILRGPDFLCRLMQIGPDQCMDEIRAGVRALGEGGVDFSGLARRLRIYRGQAALAIALADIAGIWDLNAVTGALSDFAETALQGAVDALLRIYAAQGEINLTDTKFPSHACGWVIIAMGKLGARELNYSSDIDLIVLFDPERSKYCGKRNLLDFQIRFTKELVRLLQDFTEDGYVFRTDLRLRPDPGATPIAIAVEFAESYYESAGKGWERAAMIKARPVAGDIELGQSFLKNISPFVWRKNLDFAAIRDVYEMVGLIRSHHGHAEITVPGYNIKLGAGGIREIEFFAQTHQLIAGGRDRKLRDPTTLGIIAQLQEKGQIEAEAAQKLREAYIYLRTLEHRLQMVQDEQTQTLPKTQEGLDHIASFMGYAEFAAFDADIRRHLEFAAQQFQKLIGREDAGENNPAEEIALITSPDTLKQMGFSDPARAQAIIETWQSFRYRAFRTQRARELLGQLTPKILHAMANTSDADGALLRFDDFLAAMPAGVQLLSLFSVHPWLLELIAEIMGTAPGLAIILGRSPILLDAVLSPEFLETFPDVEQLAHDLDDALEPARDFQDVLDITRRWANERKFQIGVQLLKNLISGDEAGLALSRLADTLLRGLLPRVEAEMFARHGVIPGVKMAIIAMGKLGGNELTFTSDLDLVFIYPDTAEVSNGKTPLSAGQYFARLSQRLINSLSALTGEGRLYEVDMRLRASGSQGPIAISLQAFRTYHEESAQTWEHMAWTRARLVCAPDADAAEIHAIIRGFLTRPRELKSLAQDVALMRVRIDHEHHSDNIWDFKYVRGGMMDGEFITQFLLLRYAQTDPGLLHTNTLAALAALKERGHIPAAQAETLVTAMRLFCDLQQITRLCLLDRADMRHAPQPLRNMMAIRSQAGSFEQLETRIKQAEAEIATLYRHVVLAAAGLDAEPDFPA